VLGLSRTQWGVIIAGAIMIAWLPLPLWLTLLLNFALGLFSSAIAKVVDSWLGSE
jgi:hypothetical protein